MLNLILFSAFRWRQGNVRLQCGFAFRRQKDSTAMLLMLLERGEDIADIVFFDTGWEHPEMYEHLDKLENFVGRKITRLQARFAHRN